MSAARRAPVDDRCYAAMTLANELLWCGRTFLGGETIPFRTCDVCLADFREVREVALDRRARRKECELDP